MKLGVVGVGHVGLPTAAVLAYVGHDVVAMDSDREKLEMIEDGRMPFFEPGMEEMVGQVMSEGRLRLTDDPAGLGEAEVVFICVGTPPKESGEANLLAVEKAGESVVLNARGDVILVEKSTVPAGTAERLTQALKRYRSDIKVAVVSNPEFLQEGSAIADSLRPERILVGSSDAAALEKMKELYRPILEASGAQWIATDVATAELAKHASNAFLSMKISFANAMARLCEAAGADVVKVTEAMGADPRIGRSFLDAGLGYGGYCFPKDIAAFEALASQLGYDFALLREVQRINEEVIDVAFAKVQDALWHLEGKRVALLGLAFKGGTDDTRLSPALILGQRLLDAGADVVGFDPQAGAAAKGDLPALEIAPDLYTALEGAHCAVIATEWKEFADIDLDRAKDVMTFPVIVDARNMLDPEDARRAGIHYLPMGRPPVPPAGA